MTGAGAHVEEERGRLRQALDELEQDRATGKMSPSDYATLRAKLLASAERLDVSVPSEAATPDRTAEAEALVLRLREERVRCAVCGVRPEPGARYCSSCGRHLHPCSGCGARPEEVGARYCSACGRPLAA